MWPRKETLFHSQCRFKVSLGRNKRSPVLIAFDNFFKHFMRVLFTHGGPANT